MTFKSCCISFTVVLLFLAEAYAVDYDKQYSETYGTGVIVVSDKGLPLRNKFDKSQIEFKKGISYIKSGDGANLNFRAFVKDGKDFNYYLSKKKKEYKADKIVAGSEKMVVTFWVSHSAGGEKQIEKWPVKLEDGEHLDDTARLGSVSYDLSDSMDYKDLGSDWEHILHGFDGDLQNWISNAKPGYKIYMSLNISLIVNDKWDPINQKWITLYCQTAPLASGTVEFK